MSAIELDEKAIILQPSALVADEALSSYLQAQDEAAAELALSRLLYEQAEPVIGSILRHNLRVTLREADDNADNQNALALRSSVRLQLLSELEALRSRPGGPAWANFRSHVAELTYQACDEHLRQQHPRRHNLKNKLRYLLTHNEEFALWENELRELVAGTRREVMAGRAAWRDSPPARNEDLWAALREEPAEWAKLNWPGRLAKTLHPIELLRGLFANAQGPVELDELVNVCAAIWGTREKNEENTVEVIAEYSDMASGQNLATALQLEQIEHLRQLWVEAGQLPIRQKTALLLNLRDANGRGIIALLPLTGVASLRQIATVLELTPEDLAGLWSQLPLDDAAIAARLGITRQQVINLRRAARERLARRIPLVDV